MNRNLTIASLLTVVAMIGVPGALAISAGGPSGANIDPNGAISAGGPNGVNIASTGAISVGGSNGVNIPATTPQPTMTAIPTTTPQPMMTAIPTVTVPPPTTPQQHHPSQPTPPPRMTAAPTTTSQSTRPVIPGFNAPSTIPNSLAQYNPQLGYLQQNCPNPNFYQANKVRCDILTGGTSGTLTTGANVVSKAFGTLPLTTPLGGNTILKTYPYIP